MKIEYNSIPTGTGASYKWVSNNKKVGSGEMTITSSSKDSISTAMNFSDNGIATANFIFSKSGNPKDSSTSETNVTWAMDMDMGMNPIGRCRLLGSGTNQWCGIPEPELERWKSWSTKNSKDGSWLYVK